MAACKSSLMLLSWDPFITVSIDCQLEEGHETSHVHEGTPDEIKDVWESHGENGTDHNPTRYKVVWE